ncbi:MAG: hypothetical protein RLZZ612_613 [Pseudomonadota bacterium]|jgi:HD-GYP domain-containing protein (c-di-GMP phosphodiesterase class II)
MTSSNAHWTTTSADAPKSGTDGRPTPHKTRVWPLGLVIAVGVIISMLAVATAILMLGWSSAQSALLDTAKRTASDTGQLINARARVLLDPAQSTIRQIALDPLVDAGSLDERLKRLYVLSDELTVNPLISAIYVGYENGEFLLVRPLDNPLIRARFKAPSGANFMVQARSRQSDGSVVGEYLFFDADARLEERRNVPEYTFDPRTRPWYNAANETTEGVLSKPYVFFSTQQVGLTLSRLSRSGGAVVGMDMVLDEISAALGALKLSPTAEIVLINDKQEVLAYPDMQKVLQRSGDTFGFKKVADFGNPSLQALDAANPAPGEVRFLEVQGKELLGVSVPFDVWPGTDMRLLMTAPIEELLGDLPAKRRQIVWAIAGLILILLPLGGWAGTRIGRSLDSLSAQAAKIGRFDFSSQSTTASSIKEVNQLNGVMDDMSHTIQSFLQLSHQMAVESEVDKMLSNVLHQLVNATRCTDAAVYLWDGKTQRMERAAIVGNDSARFEEGFAYPSERKPRSGARQTEQGETQLELELRGRNGQLQGLLALVHPSGSTHGEPAFVDFARQLSGSLAVSIETRQLIEAQKNLLDAVIRLMADAIDAKSPYTGGHCERVPELATMMVDRMSADKEGRYADFAMTEDQRYEFYLGAWLHDCGKVTSPEHIVDKATKLEVIYNRIHEIRTRFEVLWRDAEIEHFKRTAQGMDKAESQALRDSRQQQLRQDYAFVAECNVGSEFMADAAIERLQRIAQQTWTRYFDDTLGLAFEEAKRLKTARPEAPILPATEPLLADRADHIVAWEGKKPPVEKGDPANIYGFDMKLPKNKQNMGEVYNLSIRRGTLTDEDRFKINDHIVQTYIMLRSLPWPEQLKRVPEIAATHHEKIDGKGYPRCLGAQHLTVADRIMALADIFEALTAADRPYKAPKTLTESLRIMAFMCKDQHLDTELYRYFLHSGLWQTYADKYMKPEQIDNVDIAAIEKLLPQAPTPPTTQPQS